MAPLETFSKGQIPKKERINRILAAAGLTSRRKADEWIKAGRVTLNGQILTGPGARAVWGVDSIRVDGREIPGPRQRLYLMLNKPFGYITALSDPAGRPVVSHLLKDIEERVYPVGRLDFDSLGLLLMTNDGQWAHRLAHPRYHVPKTYKITIAGRISDEALHSLKKGLRLKDGFAGPAKVTLLERNERRSLIRLTLTMGRSRVVRRMLDAVGYRVIHLIRTGYGCLELGRLGIGRYRHLEPHEVEAMKKMVGLS